MCTHHPYLRYIREDHQQTLFSNLDQNTGCTISQIPKTLDLAINEFDGKVVRIIPATSRTKDSRGARLVAQLRGRGDVAMSTDAIMALTRDE